MRRRRRYEVVVEGLSGQAAAQRSVISDHRSEDEARENASLERARLEVIYGDGAREWRILVVHDDEVLVEEIPHAGRTRAAAAPPEPPADRDDAGAGPVPAWVIAQFEEAIARQRERTYGAAADEDERPASG